jgi:hypothetical protein
MALPGILYTASIPRGTELPDPGIASELAHALAPTGGTALALSLALMSVWILFKAQLDNFEGMTRVITDILWSGSRRVRAWRGGDVRVVYYSVLAVVATWGVVALGLTQPMVLLKIAGNVAGLTLAVSALHVLYLNTRFLPEPLRPPLWRRIGLVATSLFYGFFVCLWLTQGVRS